MVTVVTNEIIDAIEKIKLVERSNEAVGKRLGCTKKHIGNILAGKVQHIRPPLWKKMEPELRPFLPPPPCESDQIAATIQAIPPARMAIFERIAKAEHKNVGDYLRAMVDAEIDKAERYKDI